MLSIETSSNQKEQCLVNTAGGIKLPNSCFQIGFDRRRNMWTSIIMQKNNFVVSGVVVGAFAFFLVYSAQSHQLCSVESPSNGFVRFEQLIIYDTKLIPLNTQHGLFSMNVRLGC